MTQTTLALPADLLRFYDEQARAQSKAIGVKISRNAVIASALQQMRRKVKTGDATLTILAT